MRPAMKSIGILVIVTLLIKCYDSFVFPPSVQGHLAPAARRSAATCTRLGADEISGEERTKARAALVDAPELSDLVSMLNKLKGFNGADEEDKAEEISKEDAPPAEEVPGEKNDEQESIEQQPSDQPGPSTAPAQAVEASGSADQSTPATVLVEESNVNKEEQEEKKGELGAGGMADTRDPDEMNHEDPRKSISAAPTFEEYIKMRQSS